MEAPAEKISIATYLKQDTADGKLKLLNNIVVAMASASPQHNLLVANINANLHADLRKNPHLMMSQDQRVRIEETESYVYPDVVVVCDKPRFDTHARPATLLNPSAVVEVLSETTLDHNLGAKLGHYRRITSVHEVLFVHTETRAVTLVTRQDNGSWNLVDRGPKGEVAVTNMPLTLDTIYERTESLLT